MNSVEVAIMRTILYADVFNFPLTTHEIHCYLIHDTALSQSQITKTLENSSYLKQHLYCDKGYFCLPVRKQIIQIRQKREKVSQELWSDAIRYGKWLSRIPFVRMVALTGALAVRNPSDSDDDFDYLLVTTSGRVWLARAFAIILVRIVKIFGRELCPNYVLADDQLVQLRQDLYTAHEVAQMQPIYGSETYSQMLNQNKWVQDYLPNTITHSLLQDSPYRLRKIAEWLLSGWVGDKLEQWEYRRKLEKFSPKIVQPESSAEINQNSVKGHFQDHGRPVLQRYHELLIEYGLDEQQLQALAGD